MDEQATNEVFRALADPTRRALLTMLSEEAQPVSALTAHFEMTQPAVSQHLKVLKDAGLVTQRRNGRNQIYALDPEPLRHVADWLEQHVEFWTTRFDNLGRLLREKHGTDA
ncbi:MAG TPA: metalloregulator ArsR/SmtB family transcription factor [Allosphingosinicella sp.]|nr:metalloregulator ArsR/SmtB family transcription factor [Allosphingosinicella sp.]